jgi:hypothetical protein
LNENAFITSDEAISYQLSAFSDIDRQGRLNLSEAELGASTSSATEKLMAQSRDASTMSFIKQNENTFTEDIVDTSVQKFVLYIDPKQIKLEGHDHGFFPGCCGVWKNNLIVCGSTKYLKEKEELDRFLKDNNFNLIELYDGELVDVGSVFFN